jgi:hypothetical protein
MEISMLCTDTLFLPIEDSPVEPCSKQLTDTIDLVWENVSRTFCRLNPDPSIEMQVQHCVPASERALGFIVGMHTPQGRPTATAGIATRDTPKISKLVADSQQFLAALRKELQTNGCEQTMALEVTRYCLAELLDPDSETLLHATMTLLGLFSEMKGHRTVEGLIRQLRGRKLIAAVYVHLDADTRQILCGIGPLGKAIDENTRGEIRRLLQL